MNPLANVLRHERVRRTEAQERRGHEQHRERDGLAFDRDAGDEKCHGDHVGGDADE
jgi:hypothetical protein